MYEIVQKEDKGRGTAFRNDQVTSSIDVGLELELRIKGRIRHTNKSREMGIKIDVRNKGCSNLTEKQELWEKQIER